jgi:DNA-binding beta-propeller fold protein YncE
MRARISTRQCAIVLATTILSSLIGAAQAPATFRVTRTFVLGGDGSWDYLRYDAASNRLFIARSTRVMVVDLDKHQLAGEIPDTAGVHGVALVADAHRGVTSNGKANNASIFDLQSLKVQATIATGEKPDSILYDPFTHLVLTMNGHANSVTLIDAASAKAVGTISLPGRPETAMSDGKGHVYINLEDKAQIAVLDMTARAVVHTWEMAGCTEPTGLAIDLEHARLFSGCHNGVLAVVDATSGRIVQELPIGNGVDAVGFDPALHAVFTSNGEGSVSVIQQEDADRYRNRETVPTLPGAKTMALDPGRHLVYTVANRDGQFVLLEIGR